MIVCICQNVSESAITDAVKKHNCNCVESVKALTGACSCCTQCKEHIEELLEKTKETQKESP